jgi:hypothetical protein
MNAFAVAAQMLGGLQLGAGQLAQLRAVDSRHHQRLYTLVNAPAGPPESRARPGTPRMPREPTPAERLELHAMLVRDVRALLSPEQRAWIDRRAAADDPVLPWEWEGGGLG